MTNEQYIAALTKALAEQYLEGENVKTPVTEKMVGAGKKMFLWMGILASTLLAAMIFFIWNISSDDFDCADENAVELDPSV